MALKLVIDKLEDVPEAIRGEYEQDGKSGKYTLKVDGLEDTSGLKSALESERTARKALEKKQKQWEAIGKSPEEIAALTAAHEESERAKLEKKGEYDKMLAQVREQNQKVLDAKEAQINGLRGFIDTTLVEGDAARAIAEHKGSIKVLLPHVRAQTKVVEEDGKFRVVVVNDKGEPRVNGEGKPLAISDLVAEMKQSQDFGRAFEGTGHSGGGTPPGQGGQPPAGGPGNKPRSKMSTTEKAEFIAANGQEKYQSLPWA